MEIFSSHQSSFSCLGFKFHVTDGRTVSHFEMIKSPKSVGCGYFRLLRTYRQCHIMAARSSRFSDFKAINRLLRTYRQCHIMAARSSRFSDFKAINRLLRTYRQCHIMAARSSRFSDFKAINRLLRTFRQCPLSVGTIKSYLTPVKPSPWEVPNTLLHPVIVPVFL